MGRIDNNWGMEFIFERNEKYQGSVLYILEDQEYNFNNSRNGLRAILIGDGILKLKLNIEG